MSCYSGLLMDLALFCGEVNIFMNSQVGMKNWSDLRLEKVMHRIETET